MAEKDPSGLDAHAPGAKLDAGKTRPWLMESGFARALEEVAKVTTVGAIKYTPNGWAQVEDGPSRYMEAFGRHKTALGKGEILDDGPSGTGCYHKAQMIWNLLASFELELRARDTVKTQLTTSGGAGGVTLIPNPQGITTQEQHKRLCAGDFSLGYPKD